MKNIFFILTFLFAISCQPVEVDFGIAEDFLPSSEHLKNGIVSKYYSHYDAGPNKDVKSAITYESLQLINPKEIRVNRYNVGFQLERSMVFAFEANRMILKNEINIHGADTTNTEITKPIFLSWDGTENPEFEKFVQYEKQNKVCFHERQEQVRDTVVLNKAAKIFEKTYTVIPNVEEDVKYTWRYKMIYAEGLGRVLFSSNPQGNQRTVELVEQMPLEHFTTLARHGRQRVGYIDPEDVMDQNADFKICGRYSNVADYYNSHPDGRFAGGKREMLNIIHSRIDKGKLHDESGYLTFRFIVNCKGEAGLFTTEQADLNYKEKSFNKETVDHLHNIVYELKTWSPCVIEEEARDSYFYITFRMKNGEIIDVLP